MSIQESQSTGNTVNGYESMPDFYYQMRDEFRAAVDNQFRQFTIAGKNFKIDEIFYKIDNFPLLTK